MMTISLAEKIVTPDKTLGQRVDIFDLAAQIFEENRHIFDTRVIGPLAVSAIKEFQNQLRIEQLPADSVPDAMIAVWHRIQVLFDPDKTVEDVSPEDRFASQFVKQYTPLIRIGWLRTIAANKVASLQNRQELERLRPF